MNSTFTVPIAYRQSFKFALAVQLLALLLCAFVDSDGSFLPLVIVAWALFWMVVLVVMRVHPVPRRAELVAVRYGPLALFLVVFTFGQYV